MFCLLSRNDANHDKAPFDQDKRTLKNFPGTIFLEAPKQATSYSINYDGGDSKDAYEPKGNGGWVEDF
jgi:hypothetical protein